jgi:hypothetical protein
MICLNSLRNLQKQRGFSKLFGACLVPKATVETKKTRPTASPFPYNTECSSQLVPFFFGIDFNQRKEQHKIPFKSKNCGPKPNNSNHSIFEIGFFNTTSRLQRKLLADLFHSPKMFFFFSHFISVENRSTPIALHLRSKS